QAAEGGHAGIVPTGDEALVDELHQLALAHHGVAEAEARELILVGQWAREVEVFKNPIVERAMHLEFQRADAVRDSLDVIDQAMSEVIHRVDAPGVASVMMFGVADARENGIA